MSIAKRYKNSTKWYTQKRPTGSTVFATGPLYLHCRCYWKELHNRKTDAARTTADLRSSIYIGYHSTITEFMDDNQYIPLRSRRIATQPLHKVNANKQTQMSQWKANTWRKEEHSEPYGGANTWRKEEHMSPVVAADFVTQIYMWLCQISTTEKKTLGNKGK